MAKQRCRDCQHFSAWTPAMSPEQGERSGCRWWQSVKLPQWFAFDVSKTIVAPDYGAMCHAFKRRKEAA